MREPGSFWREILIVVAILLGVLVKMWQWQEQVTKLNVRSFIILQPGEGLISFNKDNSANSSGESKL